MIAANENTDMNKLVMYMIPQLTREGEDKTDIYMGDNKLIEL